MRGTALSLVIVAGCGRIAFEPRGDAGDAMGAPSDVSADSPASALVVWFKFEGIGAGMQYGDSVHANDVQEHFQGSLDELQIYNRALTPSEIQTIAAQ